MKRYLLFADDQYYPSGGWNDFKNSFHSLTEATGVANKLGGDWWHIVGSATGRIVEQWAIEG